MQGLRVVSPTVREQCGHFLNDSDGSELRKLRDRGVGHSGHIEGADVERELSPVDRAVGESGESAVNVGGGG